MSNLLNLGVSGIKAQQSLLNTVSHNIANASTEGYSRQVTELQPKTPVQIGNVLIGSGVQTAATKRVVDALQIKLHRDNKTNTESLSIQEDFLLRINNLVADAETGLSQAYSSFSQALQAASNNPGTSETRTTLLAESEKMVKRLNTLDERFNLQLRDISDQMRSVTTRINDIANSLAKLNVDIINTANQGQFTNPNDLLDQRDTLLLELSGLIGTTTVEQGDSSINVFIGNGQNLVVGGTAGKIQTQNNPDDPSKLDVIAVTQGSTFTITDVMNGGRLGGLIQARNIIDPTRATLGRVALTMGMTMNAQHKLGVDLSGNLGENYFNDPNSITSQLNRVIPGGFNQGTAIFGVAINEIPRPDPGPYKVFGQASTMVNVGTLSQLNVGELTINGQTIGASLPDPVSTADANASALSFVAAINGSVGLTGVSAKAEINSLYLGSFTTGAFIAGEFQINGQNVITTGVDEATLLTDINALSDVTGVKAIGDGNLNITLVAKDGRNIQLTSNTNTPAATFTHFDTNNGTAFNQVQRAAISITSINPGTKIVIGGGAPSEVGLSAGTTPPDVPSLTDSDYSLSYDGTNYTLTRLSDQTIVGTSTTPLFNVDGFTLMLNNGTALAGDKFTIRPTQSASKEFALQVKSGGKIALASPITVQSDTPNTLTGNNVRRVGIINTSGLPVATNTVLGNAFQTQQKLSPPIQIQFYNDEKGNPTVYKVFDLNTGKQIGPDQTFDPTKDNEVFPISSVVDPTPPGPNPTVVYDPGYRVTIGGAPKAGDKFIVSYNTDGKSDSDNAKEMIKMKDEKLLANGTETILGTYNGLVTTIGSQTQSAQSNKDAAISLERQSEARIQSLSGVNLDEEAAKLIRFQQAFRAAAQVIAAGSTLFDSIISAVRG